MPKSIKGLSERIEKLNQEIKELKRLRNAEESTNTITTGDIDALVIANKKSLKVYTEETADKIYRILIEKMNEGALTLNEDGTILYCNLSFATMVKLPLQNVIGTKFANFIDTFPKEGFEGLLKKGWKNTIKEEVYIYSGEGTAIPVLMSVNTFSLDDNFVIGIVLTDLTIQNKNQEELKLRTRELEQKNIQLALQNVEKEKRTADLIAVSEDLKAQYEKLKSANQEILNLNQNLEKRVFERTLELENLNYELKDLNSSKDKFLSVISHDLRNPLTALLVSSDALSQDTENHIFADIQPYVKVIDITSHKILDQLNELVDWAQMQRDKTYVNLEKLHLVSVVDQGLELLKTNALVKNIVLENKVPFDIYVNADTLMLRSILQNLVTNAIKYTPQSGSITIHAQRIDKMVEVCITDSGIGMEAHISKNLFKNSYSASTFGTNNEKGSGLGLVLVKDFVSQLGGTIRVESELGKGTYVFFTVPEY